MAAQNASSPSGIPETHYGVWHDTLEVPPTIGTLNFALVAAINAGTTDAVPQRITQRHKGSHVHLRACPWIGCGIVASDEKRHLKEFHDEKSPNVIVGTFLASSFLYLMTLRAHLLYLTLRNIFCLLLFFF